MTFGQKDQKDETVSGRFVEAGNEIGNGNDLIGSIPDATNFPETTSSFWSFCLNVNPPL